MKSKRLTGFMVFSVVIAVLLVFNCSNPLTEISVMEAKAVLSYTYPEEPDPIGREETPLTTSLIAGRSMEVGTVEVWIDDDMLYVKFDSEWLLKETHLEVVTDPKDFPQTKIGNPIPGHFSRKMSHGPEIYSYTYSFALSGFGEAEILYFAAHGEVQNPDEGEQMQCEGAWAEGFDFPGRNWAMYFAGAPKPEEELSLSGIWESISPVPDLFGPGTALEAGAQVIIGEGIYKTSYTANDGETLWNCMHEGTFIPAAPLPGDVLTCTIVKSDGGGSYYAPPADILIDFHFVDLTATTVTIAVDMDHDGTTDMSMECVRIIPETTPIVGIWDLEGEFTYYETYDANYDDATFFEMTLDQVMTFSDIGAFNVTGKAYPGGYEPGNEIVGKGFYVYDDSAETLEVDYVFFEMDGTGGFFPEMGVMGCIIVDDTMTMTVTADADFEPYDPFVLTRQ